jgi:phosphatidylinositol alpha-1,6-mannosyltransferase
MSPSGAHILVLLTDGYGTLGGIAQYNRDLIDALCALDEVASVEALPRNLDGPLEPLPAKLTYNAAGVAGRARYVAAAMSRGLLGPKPDIVVCAHINLLSLAHTIARARGAELVLTIFGVDAWAPTRHQRANRLTAKVDRVISISQLTLDRYLAWASAPRKGTALLPNAIHAEDYGMAPKAPDLVAQFDLEGRTVLMTFGRLDARERAKGFDEMIEALPALRERDPAILYMIAGKGDDMERLRAKASALGVADQVRFTGLVPEERKADYFRLADAYVMPSKGEGFGFVLLEAMACGVPAMGSSIDGTLEAVRGGELGTVVDPRDRDALIAGVFETLARPREIPEGLAWFAFPNFIERTREILFEPAKASAVPSTVRGKHVLVLLSDAYGGFGGISQYNRDFLSALCSFNEIGSVEAIPRLAPGPLGELPAKLSFPLDGLGGLARFTRVALRRGLFGPKPDLIVCGHINLLPIGVTIARLRGAPLVAQVHGIDAWQPNRRAFVNRMTGSADLLLSVSDVTAERYLAWAHPPRLGSRVLPNTIDLARYGPGAKAPDLLAQFGLECRTVLMTMGRLVGKDRAKGFDRVLEAMPALVARDRNITYLIAGDGDDMERLRAKADTLGVGDQVVFTGHVPEERKADYFRLADVYVMPSRGEGFGIVCLEAMACGIPTVASTADGSFEAVRGGEIGLAVDPLDLKAIETAIFASLDRPRQVPAGLAYFDTGSFRARLHELLFGETSPFPRLRGHSEEAAK